MNKKLGLVTGLLSLSVFYKLTLREVHDKMKIKFGNQWNGTEDEHCYELEFWQTSTTLHAKISAKYFNDPPPSVPDGYMMGLWDYEVSWFPIILYLLYNSGGGTLSVKFGF